MFRFWFAVFLVSIMSALKADELHSNFIGAGLGVYHLNYQFDMGKRFSVGPSITRGQFEVDDQVPLTYWSVAVRAEFDLLKTESWNLFLSTSLGALNSKTRPESESKAAGAIGTTLLGAASSVLLGNRFYNKNGVSFGLGLGVGVFTATEIYADDGEALVCEEEGDYLVCENEPFSASTVQALPLLELSLGYRF